MPAVPANLLLALTSIDSWTFLWTAVCGFIVGNIPFVYAGFVGAQVLEEFPPRNPVLLFISLLGLAATLLVTWKLGSIASSELHKAGVGPPDNNDGDVGARYRPLP